MGKPSEEYACMYFSIAVRVIIKKIYSSMGLFKLFKVRSMINDVYHIADLWPNVILMYIHEHLYSACSIKNWKILTTILSFLT